MHHETPDFCAAEREVWGSGSPLTPKSQRASVPDTSPTPNRPKSLPPQSRYSVPASNTHTAPEKRKLRHSTKRASLRPFEPLQTIDDADEPKKTPEPEDGTHQGNDGQASQPVEYDTNYESSEDEDDDDNKPEVALRFTPRASRFTEGTMTDRSTGASSSWFQKQNTGEASNNTSKPLPPTPKTKRVTFNSRHLPSPTISKSNKKAKARKGLRKNMSVFNLASFSDKMRFFTGSSSTPASEDLKPAHDPSSTTLLNERKRKAEDLYAQHFGAGAKKAKTTMPGTFPTATDPATTDTTAALNLDDSVAPAPGIGSSATASNTGSVGRTLRSSRSTAFKHIHPSLQKKRSRRELERENQELRRVILSQHQEQQQQSDQQQEQALDKVSSEISEPTESKGLWDIDPTKPPNPSVGGSLVPKIPMVPGRGVLKVIEDGGNAGRGSSENWSVLGETEDGESVAASGKGVGRRGSDRASFEWPEDVF